MYINHLSENLLLQVKMQEPSDKSLAQLEALPLASLQAALDSDARKKAFWINTYNAIYQILRRDCHVRKPAIYRQKFLKIAGKSFSLDDIEHGILRRNRIKWSLGYLGNPFAPGLLKKLAVSQVDWRIHFALNCGAKSCPPIAFYSPEKLDRQLDMAVLSFLESETEVFPEKKEIHVTRLFQWFMGDFGGRGGIQRILKEKLKLETAGMKLVFREYDWEEELEKFSLNGLSA
ncbi:MAG: DUF547 domain-containing protein [Bacteroidetes bacterium]|nr:DUF547 domain-containing protein [Bacteroidota bacterium]